MTGDENGAVSVHDRPGPSAEPPAAERAATGQPGTEPPATQPPATQPPATEPSTTQPSTTQPARRRKSRLILLSGACLAALAAIGILTANATGTGPAHHPPQAAKPFNLGELGHSGGHVALAAFAGKPVILNFFASWCVPCKRETPLLARFYAAHHGQVQVIGVDANDQKAAAEKFVRAEGVSYPIAVDPFPASTATSYGVLALPQTFFLNARHQIVRHIVGDVTAAELNSWAAQVGGQS